MKINWQYAAGEVIIVIIGISIAFMLNNWRADQIDRKQKKQYLENLVLDINKEIEDLEKIQTTFQSKLNLIKKVRPFLGNPKVRRDTVLSDFFNLFHTVNFVPENTTYQTLINSGDMKLIDDFQLRRKIEEHYAFHKTVLQGYERLENINEKYVADFFIYKMDHSKMRQGDFGFLDDPLLVNIISSLEGSFRIAIASNESCLESNRELLAEIEKR